MARNCPNERLAALLEEAGWRAADLARAVNAMAAAQSLRLTYDRTSVAHWLAGSRPRPPVPDLAAAALTRRTGRPVTAAETGLTAHRPLPRAREEPAAAPGADRPGQPADRVVHHLVELCRADADPARRAWLAGSAYVPALPPESRWPASPGPRTATASPAAPAAGARRPATAADVAALQDTMEMFAGLAERQGGTGVRLPLAAYLADSVGPLLTAPAPAAVRRDLCSAAAQLSCLLAALTADSRHQGLAQRYFERSLALARAAGDRRTYAIAMRSTSAQAARMGHPRHALALAEAAVEAAGPHADPAVRAYVLAQRALALARTGDRRRTTLDLVEAERCHERGGEAAPGYFARYPRAGLDYQRGEALSALGDTAGAVAAFTASLGGRPDDPRRRTALTRARLADVLLGAGRLDEACSHWAAFLDAYPHLRCAPAEAAVAQLRSALRPYRRASAAAALLAAARSEPRAVPVLPPV
jgi:hypothetical protein